MPDVAAAASALNAPPLDDNDDPPLDSVIDTTSRIRNTDPGLVSLSASSTSANDVVPSGTVIAANAVTRDPMTASESDDVAESVSSTIDITGLATWT
ncbi:hypothetical protein FNF31_05715 [Cafeteria roenbergensis]|uniref:Uncharacterized protein n=1 Tax=Cafeteria roenbergensis TaxID=33653 RepID=A0A5A8CZI9_CAFRO|nr:hypothetical protein FNF31_05715 [Cafeteria roenbergensis]